MSSVEGQVNRFELHRARIKERFAFRESGVLIALLIFAGIMYIISPVFRQPYNMTIIAKQVSVVAIVALGQSLVMISGGFDMSQGAIVGLVGMLSAMASQNWGFPPIAAIVWGLGLGIACGLFNGLLAARLRLHPIVVTLATASIFLGLNYGITRGRPVVGLPETLMWLGNGSIGPVPVLILMTLFATAATHILLTHTPFGVRVRMVGDNENAARAVGVMVERIWLLSYVISGFLCALAGIIMLGRLRNAVPEMGSSLLFPVVTAVIVGGTQLGGGVGSMLGTLMGAMIMGIVNNAMVVLDFSIYLQDVAQGILVVLALVLDRFRSGQLTWRHIFGVEG